MGQPEAAQGVLHLLKLLKGAIIKAVKPKPAENKVELHIENVNNSNVNVHDKGAQKEHRVRSCINTLPRQQTARDKASLESSGSKTNPSKLPTTSPTPTSSPKRSSMTSKPPSNNSA